MEVLQIFNRRTGAWSHRITLTAGYTESFVLDKSTDSAEVKWWEFTNTDIEPDYQDDDLGVLMHVKRTTQLYARRHNQKRHSVHIPTISKDYDDGNGLWKGKMSSARRADRKIQAHCRRNFIIYKSDKQAL